MENEKKGFLAGADKFFGVSARGSRIKTEIVAGIVTFLAMCYILTVNPNQFFYAGTADPRWTSVFIATAFGAVIGTLLMAFLAKLPLAQASGMGLNAMVGSVIGGGVGAFAYGFNFSLANAMFMVLASGILFLLLSIITIKGTSLRLMIFKGIPAAIRTAIPVGIGLFIAYIGFQNAGIVVTNQFTQVGFVDFTNWGEQMIQWSGTMGFAAKTASVALIGVILIAVLDKLNVKGSLIIGLIGATIAGIPFGVTNLEILKGNTPGITWKFWENFADYFTGDNSVFLIAFKDGWAFPEGSIFTVIMITLSFCMIDMFDTMGTCLGCCSAAGLLDENGTPINYDQIMYSDSIATCTGALLGTSTVTTFVESGAGVAAGGKTGLTALTTAVMFFLAIFLLPVFATIPSAAAASALIYVGALMMKGVKNLDFSDARAVIPAFLAIVVMPLGYSITKGIGIAIMSYVVIALLAYAGEWIKYAFSKGETVVNEETGETSVVKAKPVWDISVVTIIVFVLFIVYFFVPTVI